MQKRKTCKGAVARRSATRQMNDMGDADEESNLLLSSPILSFPLLVALFLAFYFLPSPSLGFEPNPFGESFSAVDISIYMVPYNYMFV